MKILFPWFLAVALLPACSSPDKSDHPAQLADDPSGDTGPLPDSADGKLVGQACPFKVPVGYHALCGAFTVPEDRTEAPTTQRTVRLEVAVFSPRPSRPSGTPVVYLEGGPGGPAIDDVIGNLQAFQPVLKNHDLVVIDQRGTGYSLPLLQCVDSGDSTPADASDPLQAVRDCRAQLAATADLSHFDTSSNAADIRDLRVTLGYHAWNLFGASYGTRLALEVMRQSADGLSGVVIDSVLPPSVDLFGEAASDAERAFEHLFVTCSQQPACAAKHPDLRTLFYDTIAAYDASPYSGTDNQGAPFTFTGEDALRLFFDLLYSESVIGYLPSFIQSLHERDQKLLNLLGPLPSQVFDSIAFGMYLSVNCRDVIPFTSKAAIDMASASVNTRLRQTFADTSIIDVCGAWSVPPADPVEHEPVVSDVPTLVLSGAYDPVTPPSWGKIASDTLSRSQFQVFAGASHGVFLDSCGGAVVSAFLDAPETPVDVSCPSHDQDIVYVEPGTTSGSSASIGNPSLANGDQRPSHAAPGTLADAVIQALRHRIR